MSDEPLDKRLTPVPLGQRQMTDDEFRQLVRERCHSLGVAPHWGFRHGSPEWQESYDAYRRIQDELETELHKALVRLSDRAMSAELRGASPFIHELARAGYRTRDAIEQAPDADLLRVPGIGPKGLAKMRERIPYRGDGNWTRCPHCSGTGRIRVDQPT